MERRGSQLTSHSGRKEVLRQRHRRGSFSSASIVLALSVVLLTLSFLPPAPAEAASLPAVDHPPLTLLIDGKPLDTSPAPFIVDGRTMVPFRAIFEALDAEVGWDELSRTVTGGKGQRFTRLTIDKRLACLDEGCESSVLLDVPARIFEDRTFVPARFIANALGAGVSWDGDTYTVSIDSTGRVGEPAPPAVAVTTVSPRQVVTGVTELRSRIPRELSSASEIKYILLDPETGRGPVIARGDDPSGTYRWTPDPAYDGAKILAAVLYGPRGEFISADTVPVRQTTQPWVVLQGLESGGAVTGTATLSVNLNFVATHIRYETFDYDSREYVHMADADPGGPFHWTPRLADNGLRTVRAAAVDRQGRTHYSEPVSFNVDVPARLSVTGVSGGRTIERPVTLSAAGNFPITDLEYVLRNPADMSEKVLARFSGSESLAEWFPGPEDAGAREIFVRAVSPAGHRITSSPVNVTVSSRPAVRMQTVGPQQVLSGSVSLRSRANVPLTRIEYQLVNPSTGARRTLAGGTDGEAAYSWTPSSGDAGEWELRAVATPAGGGAAITHALPVRVHTGPLHGPVAVIEKSKFKDFAAELALKSQRATGMSAALQVAQAILETGWGQSSPADKYTGTPSNNLFGIKGRGPAGSVTSNTWEEYDGVIYRIDDQFRAYHRLDQSWDDHKSLLLQAERYAQFRQVMHNGTMGAWALRRAGYATDSQYPVKLIQLMTQYDLYELDEIEP